MALQMEPSSQSSACPVSGPNPMRYVLAGCFLLFGIFLLVKGVRTSDTVTEVIAAGIIVYAVLRAYGKAG